MNKTEWEARKQYLRDLLRERIEDYLQYGETHDLMGHHNGTETMTDHEIVEDFCLFTREKGRDI